MNTEKKLLRLKRVGVDTYKESIAYIHRDCFVCRAEGFQAQGRVLISYNNKTLIATLNIVHDEAFLTSSYLGLSEHAWIYLGAEDGGVASISHPPILESLSHVRSKIYGHRLSLLQTDEIIGDIISSRYSDIEVSSFVTACAGDRLNQDEIINLTQSMLNSGERMTWDKPVIVDKHCVGGLPGNRTTPIVVSIVAAFGLIIPKTSSRAITSPAGTADVMEVLAPVDLDSLAIRKVLEKEGGCIVWGGALCLSPADDLLIRIEKTLNLDSEGQMVSSILSKKLAAGSTHVLIDMPIGPTAKIRERAKAIRLAEYLQNVGKRFGLTVVTHHSDGTQPVGRGIGPALEARDVVSVLRNDVDAPQDLRNRALELAAKVLCFSSSIQETEGYALAQSILTSGKAWEKFQAICAAQGGMREIPVAKYKHTIEASLSGTVQAFDNRKISQVAKLAGAPMAKAAGIDLHTPLGTRVEKGQPLFTIHTESSGELSYAQQYLKEQADIICVGEQ